MTGIPGKKLVSNGQTLGLRWSMMLWLLLALSAWSWAQPAGSPQAGAAAPPDNQVVTVGPGRSAVIATPWPVTRVSVADPKVADVQIASPTQVVVLGLGVGSTDVMLWSEDGQSMRRQVTVEVDLPRLQGDLSRIFPKSNLTVQQSHGLLAISGTFVHAEDAARLAAFMEQAKIPYVDMTSVGGLHQVLIQVRVAEASRLALRSLGINAFVAGNDFFGASTIGGNPNNIDIGVDEGTLIEGGLPFLFNSPTTIGSGVTGFFGVPPADLQVFLEALEDNQYLRVLAEPSLVALSGEEASFLAGGEFPIPVVQGGGGDSLGTSISVEFKEFGIRLRFRPTVMGDGTIRLKVAPEVSNLTDVGAVEIEGFSVPALSTRRAETTLEMKTGQTFALAGLIDQQTRAQSQRFPGLGSIPVLGALFRSVRYQTSNTELIVLATVTLVEPISTTRRRPLPGDLHAPPDDWELYGQGWIEGRNPPPLGPAHQEWLQHMGLDELQGPGAWAPTQPPPRAMAPQE